MVSFLPEQLFLFRLENQNLYHVMIERLFWAYNLVYLFCKSLPSHSEAILF